MRAGQVCSNVGAPVATQGRAAQGLIFMPKPPKGQGARRAPLIF
jgi:hypothetical protein